MLSLLTLTRRTLFLPLLAGALTAAHAQSPTPEVITTDDGATVVFNAIDTFYAFDLPGDKVQAANSSEGNMEVDRRVLRVESIPLKGFLPQVGQQIQLPAEILKAQMKTDTDEEQFKLQQPLRNVKQEYVTTPKGRTVLHWWYTMPTDGKPQAINERHFATTVCNQQVLVLRAPLLTGDTPLALRKYLLEVMNTVRESDDPIDVKAYSEELRNKQ